MNHYKIKLTAKLLSRLNQYSGSTFKTYNIYGTMQLTYVWEASYCSWLTMALVVAKEDSFLTILLTGKESCLLFLHNRI